MLEGLIWQLTWRRSLFYNPEPWSKPRVLTFLVNAEKDSMGAGVAAVVGIENGPSSSCTTIEEAQAELRY